MRFDDPVAVFNEALRAYRARDLAALAACLDEMSLEQFKRMTLRSIASPSPLVTAEELMRADPKMPREAAEYEVARAAAWSNPVERLRSEFPGVDSIEVLEAMAPVEFYFTHSEAHGLRAQILRMVADGRIPEHLAPPRDALSEVEPEAVGWVADGDRVAIVLHRHPIGTSDRDREWLAAYPEEEREMVFETSARAHPRTAVCYRQPDGTWRLVADHRLLDQGGVVGFSESPPQATSDS